MIDEEKPPPPAADPMVTRETRDRPGPRAYMAGEIVWVRLKNPPGSSEDRTWYQARVIRSSASRLTARVLGAGNEIELRIWDVRWFVRRLAEGTGT